MSSAQGRLVGIATLLAESAWLYAAFAVAGLAVGIDGSPLGWTAVLAVLTSAFLVARGLGLIIMPTTVAYSIQMLAGVVVLYLTLGTQVPSDVQGLDLGWIGKLATEGYAIAAGTGGLLGVGLWWRGGRLTSSDYPVDNLAASFRWGVIVMAIAAIVDVFHSTDLNIFPLMFLFFAAAIAGLSIGHILPPSQQAVDERAWTRVIGGVVSIVVVAGLLFSLLQRSVLVFLSAPVLIVLNALATVIFYVVFVPVGYLVDFLIRLLRGLVATLIGERQEQPTLPRPEGFGEALRRLQEDGGGERASALLHVVEWTLVAILVLLVLYLLAKTFRRGIRWRRVQAEGQRESIEEDVDPAYDMARLLFNLIPQRFRRVKRRQSLVLPDDDPDVVDVFRIYFGLLIMAEERGSPRRPSETPAEYQRTLEQMFPRNLVRAATDAFIRACYGHHPASRQQIEEMRTSVDQIASGAG